MKEVQHTTPDMAVEKIPFADISFARPQVSREERSDGTMLVRSIVPLGEYERSLAQLFRSAVEAQASRTFLVERDETGAWRSLSYGQARRIVDAVAQALIDRGLCAERPVMILSGNSSQTVGNLNEIFARDLFQCACRLWGAFAVPRNRFWSHALVLCEASAHLLRGGGPAAGLVAAALGCFRLHHWSARSDDIILGYDRNCAAGNGRAFPSRRSGQYRRAGRGVELKLVPNASKLEIRVRGLNVSPGYWKRPDLTAASYDDEGFYRPGDAVRFANPDDPARGLIFDGRKAEDFKLTTGTWVNVGSLRLAVLGAASPALHDVVVCGENRDSVGLLCWLNAAGCRTLIGADAPSSHAELARHHVVREHVRAALAQWNATQGGSLHRIARILLLRDLPSIDANEITDKGYVNQRAALQRRSGDVERIFAPDPDADVITFASLSP